MYVKNDDVGFENQLHKLDKYSFDSFTSGMSDVLKVNYNDNSVKKLNNLIDEFFK